MPGTVLSKIDSLGHSTAMITQGSVCVRCVHTTQRHSASTWGKHPELEQDAKSVGLRTVEMPLGPVVSCGAPVLIGQGLGPSHNSPSLIFFRERGT